RTKQRAAADKEPPDHADSRTAGHQQISPHGIVVPTPRMPGVIQADADHYQACSTLADQASGDIAYNLATQLCTQPSSYFELRQYTEPLLFVGSLRPVRSTPLVRYTTPTSSPQPETPSR